MHSFKLNPTPRVLIVLTETAMKPIDALCELVDNSIDSFAIQVSAIPIPMRFILKFQHKEIFKTLMINGLFERPTMGRACLLMLPKKH